MASEKSRYHKNTGPQAPIPFSEIHKVIDKLPASDLSRLVYQASQYNKVLAKVTQLHSAFIECRPDDVTTMKQAIEYAFYVDRPVTYKHSDSYCQIPDEVAILIERIAASGKREVAIELLDYTIEIAECCLDWLQDAHYFEMSIERLSEMKEGLIT